MTVGIRTLLCATLCWSVVTGAAAQELRDVGWTNTYFDAYRSAVQGRSEAPQPGGGPAEGGSSMVWLMPVFGILGTGEDAPGATAGPVPPLQERVPDWPGCAGGDPQIKTVPATAEQAAGLVPGSWYVRTFDFGCVVLVLEGDRNAPDPSAGPGGELQESGTVELSFYDENAGAVMDPDGNELPQSDPTRAPQVTDRGKPILTITIGNLPYSLTVDCVTPESRSFCNSEAGLRSLAEQLVVIAGDPTR